MIPRVTVTARRDDAQTFASIASLIQLGRLEEAWQWFEREASGEKGPMTEAYMANTSGMTGTNWTQQSDGGMSWAAGVGCVGTAWNNTVGTPTLPSATFNLAAQSMRKFIAALVVREAPPPPPAGGGLFWGQ